MTIRELARAEVAAIPLYQPETGACVVDLSDNTSVWGPPPAVLRTLQEFDFSRIAHYPSIYSDQLRPEILRYLGLPANADLSVVMGCGSDDVIDATMRAFGSAGDRIAYCAPTFAMVPVFARINSLVPVEIPFTSEFDIDAERLVDAKAQITYLCAPNNPTGTAASWDAVEYVVRNASGLVFIDAAYAEFASTRFEALLADNERLILARTFSKAFGMAGLRIGYGVANSALTQLCERARGPYKVNAVAERAAFAALADTEDGARWVALRAREAVANRDRFTVALHDLGFVVLPSDANFVLVPYAGARGLFEALRSRGILVRFFARLGLNGIETPALRISVGSWEIMERVLTAMKEALECA